MSTLTKKRSLFEIGEDLEALEQLLESLDGDITDPAADEAITAWLKEFERDQAIKADAYVNLIRKWENEEAAAEAEREQYAKIRDVRKARVARMKQRLKEYMEQRNRLRIETSTGRTVAVQKNGGKVPMEVDATVDPRRLPERFQRVTVELDTEAVRKALEAGEELEFASLKPAGTHIRIK